MREGEIGVILPAGIAISFLLFGIIMSVARTEQRAVRLADMITAKLRESEERVRAITESATDAILSADSRGLIVYFNPAAERIFGRSAQEVVGQPVTLLMPNRYQSTHAHAMERFLRRQGQGLRRTVEMIGRRADGTEFPLSVSLSSWQAGDVFFTGILRDITDRKLAEQNILKLNQELTEALVRSEKLAITGRFMATLAHEINNPLEALTNLLFMLESEALSPSSQKFVRMAQDQVALLSNISRQTLSPHRETKFPTVTNVSELLDDVLSMLRPKLLRARVQVVRLYPASVELTIYPSELRQVFTNLVANAIDAMSGGGRLVVAVVPAADVVEISVADTGTGIAPEHQSKLFEPFFTTKGEEGTGVGLWVVKEIVKKIGGTIELVTSTAAEDHGTKFSVLLPTKLRPAKAQPEELTRGVGQAT
jgi:PAS domain S-box-containing protein